MDGWRGSNNLLTTLAQRHGKLERELWSETALWLLCFDRVKLMHFLVATHAPLYPPINWIEDCLSALARHYHSSPPQRHAKRFGHLIRTFFAVLDRETKEQFIFAGSFIRLLLPHFTDVQADDIWERIKLGKIKVHYNTILHFAEYYIKREQVDRSLDALLEANAAGAASSSVAFRSGCSTLLRKSMSHPGGFRMCLRLVEHLSRLGLHLDTRLYNIIILNAIEAGDLQTGHALYRAMLEQRLTPDQYTCAIRLKACKRDIHNAGLLRDVIQDAVTYGNVRTEPLVSSEVLHCLALHHAAHSRSTAFATLAAAYSQFFEPEPLERLGLKFPEDSNGNSSVVHTRMQPTRYAIFYMLSVYLDLNASADETAALYTQWRQGVEAGDPALAACATTPHLSNVFLHRFTRKKSTLLQAAQVLKDMQSPLPSSSGVEQAPPSLITWSIFLHGFAERGELKLAEQVLAYMQSKGMEPDHVTWTSLVGGYAGEQDAEGLVDAVRRSEAAGHAWSAWDQGGLQRFNDKQRLREILETERYERELDFTGDIKGTLEGRLAEAETGDASTFESKQLGSGLRQDGDGAPLPPVTSTAEFADSSAELAELAGSYREIV
ncbi:hypothetical protein LTR53_015385 [Teratosphaeriaceae sp. CCFEE 6253]|nr:hypothetical protein LTR53_015385 [Teratosphaeriaceae sp. CCFEE 6253]